MDTSSPGRQSLTFSFTLYSPSLYPEWFWELRVTAVMEESIAGHMRIPLFI